MKVEKDVQTKAIELLQVEFKTRRFYEYGKKVILNSGNECYDLTITTSITGDVFRLRFVETMAVLEIQEGHGGYQKTKQYNYQDIFNNKGVKD